MVNGVGSFFGGWIQALVVRRLPDRAESHWETIPVLQGLELRLGVPMVIRNLRAAVRSEKGNDISKMLMGFAVSRCMNTRQEIGV